MSNQLTKLDSKGRVSIGRYTESEPGAFYRITRGEGGTLTLTPVVVLQEVAE